MIQRWRSAKRASLKGRGPVAFWRVKSRPRDRTETVGSLPHQRILDLQTGLSGAKRLGASLVKAPTNQAAISVPEICAVNFLLSHDRDRIRRIAELGTFTGWTANILAELSHPEALIEIYDFFEHNDSSRASLADHPHFNSSDFFDIWRHNVRNHKHRFEIYRGDLNETAAEQSKPLDMLFVDIVKHESLVNTVVDPFYDRLRVGGYLLHQDYYHWQSPWLVYQMELLSDAFVLLEDFGNNMSVFVKRRDLTEAERAFDYVNGLPREQQYELFDRAIDRHPGLRAGNLLASKLRLTLTDPNFDSEALQAEILRDFGDNDRISGYAIRIMERRHEIADVMW